MLIKAPLNSLYNILSNPNRHFTLHNDLYELIQSNYIETNDAKIFVLLQFLDGNLITRENLLDSIRNKNIHYNFNPKFDFSIILPNDKIQIQLKKLK